MRSLIMTLIYFVVVYVDFAKLVLDVAIELYSSRISCMCTPYANPNSCNALHYNHSYLLDIAFVVNSILIDGADNMRIEDERQAAMTDNHQSHW